MNIESWSAYFFDFMLQISCFEQRNQQHKSWFQGLISKLKLLSYCKFRYRFNDRFTGWKGTQLSFHSKFEIVFLFKGIPFWQWKAVKVKILFLTLLYSNGPGIFSKDDIYEKMVLLMNTKIWSYYGLI